MLYSFDSQPNKPNNPNQNTNSESTVSNGNLSFIRMQIDNNVRDLMNKIISTKEYGDDTIVITIDLERATDDNFKVFNDFVNKKCEFKYKNYIIDLSKALFLDSTFLGCIVIFLKKVKGLGGNFNLIIDSEKIKILQPFINLEKILNVKPNLEQALKK